MIGKTRTGRGFKGTVRYCLQDDRTPEILDMNGLSHIDKRGITHEFVALSSTNDSISKPVWHSSLSFSNEDNISNEKMVEVANRFMEKAGFSKENNQWVIIKHNNTKHTHCHIVANRVGFDGRTVSDYYSKSRTVQYAKEIEEEYKLVKVRDVSKKQRMEKELGITADPIKDSLKSTLQRVVSNGNVNSFDKFINTLKKEGVDVHLAKHKKTGKIYGLSYTCKGIKYKGSELGKKFALNGIYNHFGGLGISNVVNIAPTLKVIKTAVKIVSKVIELGI